MRAAAFTQLLEASGYNQPLVKLAIGHALSPLEASYNKFAKLPMEFYRAVFRDWAARQKTPLKKVG